MNSVNGRARTALIVGASRGLGLALTEAFWSRGWRVIATQRGPAPQLQALAARAEDAISLVQMDVTSADDLAQLQGIGDGGMIDLLLVNAGLSIARDATPASAETDDFVAMTLTNALFPVRIAEKLRACVRAGGVIAFMSSELASISSNPGTHDLYSASKSALNMLVRCFATRDPERGDAVILLAPGWVRTAIGGSAALLSVEEVVPDLATTLERNLDVPGFRFIDRFNRPVPW